MNASRFELRDLPEPLYTLVAFGALLGLLCQGLTGTETKTAGAAIVSLVLGCAYFVGSGLVGLLSTLSTSCGC